MFKDTDEELKRLEAELLAEDEDTLEEEPDILDDPFIREIMEDMQEPEPPADATQIYATSSWQTADIDAYNGDRIDTEQMSGELREEEPQSGSIKGLLITALCLAAGIVALLLWWYFRYRGML